MVVLPEATSPVFELRHYTPAEGRAEALRKRFTEVSFRLFERHGFNVAGFWADKRSDDLWYLLRWADDGARRAGWAAFLQDDEWRAAVEASEGDGPLIASIDSVRLESWPFPGG